MNITQEQAHTTVTLLVQDKPKSEQDMLPNRIPVILPDMFVSFLAQEPRVNPNYERVKAESEAWLSKKCDFDQRMRGKVASCDFSYFVSISAPEAGLEELRTMCDWGNWVFPWDDMFDEGHLGRDPKQAQQMMDSLLSSMRGQISDVPKAALVDVHDTVWQRIVKDSSLGVQTRFHKAMESYCKGALEHVNAESQSSLPTLEEQLDTRRRSVGVTPVFALIEYVHKLDLPDHVFEHPAVKEIERLGTDFVMLQNDILSYLKEEKEGVNHNIVAICRLQGLSAQKSFDRINDILKTCYRDWYLALADLPQWGEEIDQQVQKYAQGLECVIRANLNWSFKSQRYLGKEHSKIRKTRLIHVLPRPADMAKAEPELKEIVRKPLSLMGKGSKAREFMWTSIVMVICGLLSLSAMVMKLSLADFVT